MRTMFKTGVLVPVILTSFTTLLPVANAQDDNEPQTNEPQINEPQTDERTDTARTNTDRANNARANNGLENVIVGRNLPLTVKFRDLDDTWRQLTISSLIEADKRNTPDLRPRTSPNPDKELQTLVTLLGNTPGAYYTQGQTVTTGNDSFLIAYSIRFDETEFNALFEPRPTKPTQEEITQTLEDYMRDQTLELSLLNLRLVGSMNNIRPFSLDRQIASLRRFIAARFTQDNGRTQPAAPGTGNADPDGETGTTPRTTTPGRPLGGARTGNGTTQIEPAQPNSATPGGTADATTNSINARSVSNLTQIGEALSLYIQENNGVMPAMQDAATVRRVLGEQMDDTSIFLHPKTKEAYQPNPILSGKKLAHITNPAAMVAFYEASPAADGRRAILFLDGRVKRIKEAEWPQVKQASKIPMPETNDSAAPAISSSSADATQKTVALAGPAALNYLYAKRNGLQSVNGPQGRYFKSQSTGRIYYRDLKTGSFQWVSPPKEPIRVPLDEAQAYKEFAGYNGSMAQGKSFGGYGPGAPNYTDALPAQPLQ